ncbi:MAG: polysaccharide deacetylase family protein [Butyrivibrio sp.]|nr:polysaccharide deacetylase family protein [Butyrivibrio sp.]
MKIHRNAVRRLAAAVTAGLAGMLCAGCGEYTINLISDEVVINVGGEVSKDIGDYVRASKQLISEMTLDVSSVNPYIIGSYTASVTHGDNVRKFTIRVADIEAPSIELKSDKIYFELQGVLRLEDVVESVTDISECEYGFSDDMTKADRDKAMRQSISYDKEGEYTAEIIARDEYGNISVKEIGVFVVNEGKAPEDVNVVTDYSRYMNTEGGAEITDLADYGTAGVYYGVGNTVEPGTGRPVIDYYTNAYGKFRVDFIQPDSRYIWLTFNEIQENGNTTSILNTLAKKDVKAVFFVTLNYVKNNPELVQRMLDEGHVIGSYTANCSNIPDLTSKELTSELDTLYNYVYTAYGYEMYLFRAPSGYFSEQSLAVAQSLGYRTVFWSFAYADWDISNQPDVGEALSNAVERAHGGAVYQLSGASSANREMLSDMIDGIRARGYEFAEYQKF